jgi:septal ring factor EnvC (AmiA/AmiB activator)
VNIHYFTEDLDSTSELPQLDARIVYASLERVSPTQSATLIHPQLQSEPATATQEIADCRAVISKFEDASANLCSRFASLVATTETLRRQLLASEATIEKNEQMLSDVVAKHSELEQQQARLLAENSALKATLESQYAEKLRRDQFIIKQAEALRQLRVAIAAQ